MVFFCESDKNKTGFCVIECCTIGFSLSEEWDFQAPRRNGIITQTHKKAFFIGAADVFDLIERMVQVMMVKCMCCV